VTYNFSESLIIFNDVMVNDESHHLHADTRH